MKGMGHFLFYEFLEHFLQYGLIVLTCSPQLSQSPTTLYPTHICVPFAPKADLYCPNILGCVVSPRCIVELSGAALLGKTDPSSPSS